MTDRESLRKKIITGLRTIIENVTPLLAALPCVNEVELAASLKPRPGDYAKVFRADIADPVMKAYEELWSTPIKMKVASDQIDLVVNPSPAGMLSEENELSCHFPGGYRKVAEYLNPHRVWVAWKYRRPGESAGMAFDGLVWVDDHWAWFPKPYRVIDDILEGRKKSLH